MLTISRDQIEAIRWDTLLGPVTTASLSDPTITNKSKAKLADSEWDDLHDACLDALKNNSPVVETFDAEQSKGIYTVSIHGVPGAYFVTASEFDDSGVFTTLDEARAEADASHGEFRVNEMTEDQGGIDESPVPGANELTYPDRLLVILSGGECPEVVERNRDRILKSEELLRLASGSRMLIEQDLGAGVSELVACFDRGLPKPQGHIAGMARLYMRLPKLKLRVELFRRINDRLPSNSEMAELFDVE